MNVPARKGALPVFRTHNAVQVTNLSIKKVQKTSLGDGSLTEKVQFNYEKEKLNMEIAV
jgi:hypothetical protein